MEPISLLAGAGKAEVLWQPEDFPLEGFSGQHDPVFARALLLRGGADLVLLSLELTSLPPRAIARFQELAARLAGIPAQNVFVSVSHTFSAPHLPREEKTQQDRRLARILYTRLEEAAARAVQAARADLGPAVTGWDSTPCALNVNRNVQTPRGWWLGRNEREYSDHSLRCLRLCHGDRPIALILNYDCQPSVLDGVVTRAGQRLLSGDFAGAALRTLEARYPGLTAFYLPGAAGDQSPLLCGVTRTPEGACRTLYEDAYVLAEEQGRYLADCAEGPLRHARTHADAARLALTLRTVPLPEQEMPYATPDLTPHRSYAFLPTGRTLEVPLALVGIGPLAMLLTPPELNSAFGQALRQILGPDALIGTLVNGAMKYLPQDPDYQRITYTAMNTMLGRGSDELFRQAVAQMMQAQSGV